MSFFFPHVSSAFCPSPFLHPHPLTANRVADRAQVSIDARFSLLFLDSSCVCVCVYISDSHPLTPLHRLSLSLLLVFFLPVKERRRRRRWSEDDDYFNENITKMADNSEDIYSSFQLCHNPLEGKNLVNLSCTAQRNKKM